MSWIHDRNTGEIIDAEDGQLIATTSGSATNEQANLLAAAPDLLKCLCEMLGAAEIDCMDDKSNVWRSLMLNAQAAVDFAEGVQTKVEMPV